MTHPAKPFLIDMHVHTIPRSLDSGLKPDVAVERAKAAGLSAVLLTEHNAIWTRDAARELSERHEFPVFRGIEVGSDCGHVIVVGVDVFANEMVRLDLLRHIVETEGAAMILAHPTRAPGFPRGWDEAGGLFEGLEVLNADESPHARRVVAGIAADLGLPGTGGSDAHSPVAVGRCATAFEARIREEHDIVEALKSKMVAPWDLRA